MLAGLAGTRGISWPAALAGMTAYAFACELYIFTFTLVTSSVSVSLLLSRLAPSQSVQRAPTLSPEAMVRRRLDNMAEAGLLRARDGRYFLTPKSQRLVRLHRQLRRFFHSRATNHPA